MLGHAVLISDNQGCKNNNLGKFKVKKRNIKLAILGMTLKNQHAFTSVDISN